MLLPRCPLTTHRDGKQTSWIASMWGKLNELNSLDCHPNSIKILSNSIKISLLCRRDSWKRGKVYEISVFIVVFFQESFNEEFWISLAKHCLFWHFVCALAKANYLNENWMFKSFLLRFQQHGNIKKFHENLTGMGNVNIIWNLNMLLTSGDLMEILHCGIFIRI